MNHPFNGKLVQDMPEDELADILQQVLQNDLCPNLSNKLIRPYIDIAKYHGVPVDMFRKLKTVVSPHQFFVENNQPHALAGVDWDYTTGISTLHLHENYEGSTERLADISIHEAGHILGNYKNYIGNYPDIMPNVPLPHSQDKSMDEGFSEFLRAKFSAKPNIFPDLDKDPKYVPPLVADYRSMLTSMIGRGISISQILMLNDYRVGIDAVPSILYHADELNKNLIQNYNKYISAEIAGDKQTARLYESVINDVFLVPEERDAQQEK